MTAHRPSVLVVTADDRWKDSCTRAFIRKGCVVTTVKDGQQALDILQRHSFDIVADDDSYPDMGPLEFTFNVRDVAANEPVILLGGTDLEQFEYVWTRWKVFFAGPKQEVIAIIPASVEKVLSHSYRH